MDDESVYIHPYDYKENFPFCRSKLFVTSLELNNQNFKRVCKIFDYVGIELWEPLC